MQTVGGTTTGLAYLPTMVPKLERVMLELIKSDGGMARDITADLRLFRSLRRFSIRARCGRVRHKKGGLYCYSPPYEVLG